MIANTQHNATNDAASQINSRLTDSGPYIRSRTLFFYQHEKRQGRYRHADQHEFVPAHQFHHPFTTMLSGCVPPRSGLLMVLK